MKTFITTSSKAHTGYELHIVDDKGKTTVKLIDTKAPGEPYTLVLPENPSNRKYFSTKKLQELPPEGLELTYKETRSLGKRLPGSGSTQKLTDFATPEELKVYENLLAKWKERREMAKKASEDPIKKAEDKIAKLQAEVERLRAEKAAKEAAEKATKEAKGE